MLGKNCYACHTATKLGGLQLDTREAALRGGKSGPAIVPGDPENSLCGGLSHVDSFDPKPVLARHNGEPSPIGNPKTERKTGNLMQSPFEFRRHGKSGVPMSSRFPRLGAMIDDLCVIRLMHTDIPNHPP